MIPLDPQVAVLASHRAPRSGVSSWTVRPALALVTPWDWFRSMAEGFHEFVTKGPAHDFILGASMFLIVGGLSVLFLIASLLLLQSLVPSRLIESAVASGEDGRQLRPLHGGRSSGLTRPWKRGDSKPEEAPPPVPRADRALDAVVADGLGEPRLLHYQRRHAVVRMLRCRGCEAIMEGGKEQAAPGCNLEAQSFAAAFQRVFQVQATAREIACRIRGQSACDFEVRFN